MIDERARDLESVSLFLYTAFCIIGGKLDFGELLRADTGDGETEEGWGGDRKKGERDKR